MITTTILTAIILTLFSCATDIRMEQFRQNMRKNGLLIERHMMKQLSQDIGVAFVDKQNEQKHELY